MYPLEMPALPGRGIPCRRPCWPLRICHRLSPAPGPACPCPGFAIRQPLSGCAAIKRPSPSTQRGTADLFNSARRSDDRFIGNVTIWLCRNALSPRDEARATVSTARSVESYINEFREGRWLCTKPRPLMTSAVSRSSSSRPAANMTPPGWRRRTSWPACRPRVATASWPTPPTSPLFSTKLMRPQ
jgi:hypothetical protein